MTSSAGRVVEAADRHETELLDAEDAAAAEVQAVFAAVHLEQAQELARIWVAVVGDAATDATPEQWRLIIEALRARTDSTLARLVPVIDHTIHTATTTGATMAAGHLVAELEAGDRDDR